MSHSDRLEQMKKEYHAIPVPEDARERVKAGMREARADKKVVRRKLWQRSVTAAAAVFVCFVMGCNLNPHVAYAMSEIPILGDIAKVVTFRTYENHIGDMEAQVKVPVVEDDDPTLSYAVESLNKTVEEYTNQIIMQFEEEAKMFGEDGRMDLITDYEVVTNTDRWFSLRINTDMVRNGSMRTVMIYHIDKSTGKMVKLKDLFREDSEYQIRLAQTLVAEMERMMAEDPEKSFFVGKNSHMADDMPEGIPADQNFYINERGKLVLVFDKYTVAPGSMGIVEVEIPTEEIADIVKEGYLKNLF